MRKQIARTISIVTLLVTLSTGAGNAWAGCSTSKCVGNGQVSVQYGTQAGTQAAPSEESLSLDEYFLVLRVMGFLLWL